MKNLISSTGGTLIFKLRSYKFTERVTPDILASGGGTGEGGGIGTLLLLNLFKEQIKNSNELTNGSK